MDNYTNPADDLLFLTPQEVDYLQDVGSEPPGFIGDFVEWAGRQSDASPYALRSGALLALSLAAGEAVQARGLFGSNIYLNLYVLIVGPSTIVRKTTVLDMVRKVLPLDATGKPFVNFEDDFSIQALAQNAAQASGSGRPTLVDVDEVAALFKNMKTSAHYLNGLDSLLLKSYDHSPVHISRTHGRITLPDGAFMSVMAANTPEGFREAVTEADLTSGLIPRFILINLDDVISGSRPHFRDRVAGRKDWELEAETLRATLAKMLPESLAWLTASPDRKQTVLEWTPEALDRLNDLDDKMHRERSVAGRSDTIGAVMERAAASIAKVAALYKLSRAGTDGEIELVDVLRAMSLIEETTRDLLVLSNTVGMSKTTLLLDAVEEAIRKLGAKGLRTPGYLKAKITPRLRSDIDEYRPFGVVGILTRLVAEKRIVTRPDGSGWLHSTYGK